jgi:hypothetical protein
MRPMGQRRWSSGSKCGHAVTFDADLLDANDLYVATTPGSKSLTVIGHRSWSTGEVEPTDIATALSPGWARP